MVKVKPVIILLMLIPIIASGCIEQDDTLPQQEILSDFQKEAFTTVDPGVFLNNPEEFTDRNILIRGKVSWISYEGGKTVIIINLQTYNQEPVVVYYQGRLPSEYRGTDVAVYGIAKGRNMIKNTNTGEDMLVPQIFAVQVNPSWIDDQVSSNPDVRIVAESRSLSNGETWDMGSGYTLLVNAIDEKDSLKQAWISLERGGKKLDDKVLREDMTYTYQNKISFSVQSISNEKILLKNVRMV